MSTSIMAACWPLKMPTAAKSVLISLADNANDHGECWPSIDTIAERTCMHRATVMRAIATLEQLGYLVADRSNGRHTRYVVTPNLGLFDSQKPVAQRDVSQYATGRNVQRTSRTVRPDQSQRATKPVAERDTNRQEPSRTIGATVRVRASRLPTDWQPSESVREWFASKFPGAAIDEAVDEFRDFWSARAGPAALKTDWDATFRNSVRKFPPKPRGAHQASGKQSALEAANRSAAREWLKSHGDDHDA